MTLGREVELGPGDIVLVGAQLLRSCLGKVHSTSSFRPMSIVAKRSPIPAVELVDLCYWTVVLSCPVSLSVTLVYCGQTVRWIKTPLGTEVGLGADHIALDGDPAPPPKKGGTPPIFGPCQAAGWIKMPLGREVGLGPADIVLDGDPVPPSKRGKQPSPLSAHVYCGQTVAHLSNC